MGNVGWLLAYWTALMVNASLDVYLEGPQGGIWSWSLVGFVIALTQLQRVERRSGAAASAPVAGQAT